MWPATPMQFDEFDLLDQLDLLQQMDLPEALR
jgi:hypothetical protein